VTAATTAAPSPAMLFTMVAAKMMATATTTMVMFVPFFAVMATAVTTV